MNTERKAEILLGIILAGGGLANAAAQTPDIAAQRRVAIEREPHPATEYPELATLQDKANNAVINAALEVQQTLHAQLDRVTSPAQVEAVSQIDDQLCQRQGIEACDEIMDEQFEAAEDDLDGTAPVAKHQEDPETRAHTVMARALRVVAEISDIDRAKYTEAQDKNEASVALILADARDTGILEGINGKLKKAFLPAPSN